MAIPTVRAGHQVRVDICWSCHGQMIEALGEEDFLRNHRWDAGDDGYWRVTVASNQCARCTSGFWSFGGEGTKSVTVCLTSKQYYDATFAGCVGAVTNAPERVHGGSIQMSNMRHNTPDKDQKGDGLHAGALLTFWPYITSCLVSDDELVDKRSYRSHCFASCCGGTTHRLQKSVFVKLKSQAALIKKYDAEEAARVAEEAEEARVEAEQAAAARAAGSDGAGGIPARAWWTSGPLKRAVGEDGKPTKSLVLSGRHDRLSSKLPGVYFCLDTDTRPDLATEKDAIAIGFGPDAGRHFFANTPANLLHGIEKRMEEPRVPVTLTLTQISEMADIVAAHVKQIREDPLIDEICQYLLFGEKFEGLNGDASSKRWSPTRASEALMQAVARVQPEYKFTAAIKIEPMGDGKPPRVLIADGDIGAVMSAFSIGVLERWTIQRFGKQTIKGDAKAVVMDRIIKATEYRPPLHGGGFGDLYEGEILENDASAWDACCGQVLRDLTENQLLDAIYDRVAKYVAPYNLFTKARQQADKKKKLKLEQDARKVTVEMAYGNERINMDMLWSAMTKRMFRRSIDAIRRSGDRGTSILNWWVNRIVWLWVLCGPNGWKYVKVTVVVVQDIFGVRRRIELWFEGDDSFLWLAATVKGNRFTDAQIDVLHQRWVLCGMRPKLFLRTQGKSYDAAKKVWTDESEAEFCGWKFTTNDNGLEPGSACPDMPRLLAGCFYSTDKAAIKAAQVGDADGFGLAVGPALIARASQIATTCPSVAQWLLNLAGSLGDANLHQAEFSRDQIYKLGAGKELESTLPEGWKELNLNRFCDISYGTYLERTNLAVSSSLAAGGLECEARLAIAHKWVSTKDEWISFTEKLPLVGLMTTRADFEAILPPRMRK